MSSGFLARVMTGITDSASGRVIVGFNWTAVEGPATRDGHRTLGLAATPSKADGAHTTEATGTFGGQPLSDLARLLSSDNPYERAIGLAASNAHWNTPAFEPTEIERIADGDGLGIAPDEAARIETSAEMSETKTVVIGRFPALDRKLPGAIVLERNPGPDDLPAERAPDIVPTADRLIITATTLVNGSIDGLLALARPDCAITLVGPGTPLCPELLKTGRPNSAAGFRSVNRLAGFIVMDVEGCAKAIMEGAGARAFRRFGKQVVLEA